MSRLVLDQIARYHDLPKYVKHKINHHSHNPTVYFGLPNLAIDTG